MDPTATLAEACAALAATARRTADLVRSLPDAGVPIPGSEWTVRDAAVHLVNWGSVYADMATGLRSPVDTLEKTAHAANNAQRLADVPETDPGKLARLLDDAVAGFLSVATGRLGGQPVAYHCGLEIDLASLVALSLAETVLHGYDIATAVKAPWPLDPDHVRLVLGASAPLYRLFVDRAATAQLSVAYGVELGNVGRFTVRFVEGEYALEPPDSGPVDCTIWADPVAFLLVGTGRLSRWPAFALGHIKGGGRQPELASRFHDLFVFP